MALRGFHPIVAEWFATTLGEPTRAQADGWEAIRSGRHTLVAAPTGSGKTLAAFLTAIDDLFREGVARGALPDETRVVYVSPLKALSTDIHRNLSEPRDGIRRLAAERGLEVPDLTAAVRTGDTPSSSRAAMLRSPPHLLVTTPESLYLLLTAERSRAMLRTVRAVIVDEIHAVIESRRGAHLALSLERLQHVAGRPLQRIGLSATQRPIDAVAQFLVGGEPEDGSPPDCAIIDQGHQRITDLALEIPKSPLETVMSHEVWEEVFDRLAELIGAHRTTLVFVNTRRMAERVAKHLSERLGEEWVTAHHGSLSKEKRLDAEERLKRGALRALVATASLELGIDIGTADLVCQLGSTRRISTLLQRVGRSGHTVHGTPKGRLFPLTRDDLAECAALVRAVRRGELDSLITFERPLDVLAQQVVAEAACEEWDEAELYRLVRRAHPYRNLTPAEFEEIVTMVARGFATRRGRRGALLHHDAVNQRVRGRRGARLTAITAGGAIPDNADYRVVLEPDETVVGTLNEDFAVESMAGDVFQLGNASWRILQVAAGTVRVADARGEPPTIPFWLGEAPSRTLELSAAVSELRRELDDRLGDPAAATEWLAREIELPRPAATQLVRYFGEARHILGVLPSQDTLVLERFFDESGGMQLVLHAPFGARVNRAWGLALRKRFCRQFNFELQAAATDNALLLSLGPQHSFPLDDVFRYLHPGAVGDLLVQAVLDAPVFQTRWRWNATLALAVLRHRGGRKVPPQLQRMEAEDIMAAVFPDAAACLENIAGDREIPDHPLVRQTLKDCLDDAMDLPGLLSILERVHAGEIRCVARDTPEPSPLSHEILNAMPYQFLDDAPLEERRTQAVYTRRAFEPSSANELGALDRHAIARVGEEAWPDVRDAHELHDALVTAGYLTEVEGVNGRDGSWLPWFEELLETRRATRVTLTTPAGKTLFWVAAERLRDMTLALGGGAGSPDASAGGPERGLRVAPPVTYAPPGPTPAREDAIKELLRGRLEIVGPTTVAALAASARIAPSDVEVALAALEREGTVLRGRFTPGTREREWCDRRLLARIHRYTLSRLRAEIEPVSAAVFMRFLFGWQKVHPEARVTGVEGLAAVIRQLDGFELAAGSWEPDVLSARVTDYDATMLDALCLTGRVAWGRLSPPNRPGGGPFVSGPIASTPVALFARDHAAAWLSLAPEAGEADLTTYGRSILDVLGARGAMFFQEIVRATGLLATHVEQGLGTLVALGKVTSDSFGGLRALLVPSAKRPRLHRPGRRSAMVPSGVEAAGRWSVMRVDAPLGDPDPDDVVTAQAWALLRRYGVVFRRLLARETNLAPWRDLTRLLRRLEARGDVRGGRFVAGMSGEQYALPEAVGQLRATRRRDATGEILGLGAADPLNLTGVVTPGDRIPAVPTNRVVYRDGVPLACREGGDVRALAEYDPALQRDIDHAIVRRRPYGARRPSLGRAG